MTARTKATEPAGRLMDVQALMDYLQIGRNSALKFGEAAGARIQIGRRVLYDRKQIDRAIDAMTERGN